MQGRRYTRRTDRLDPQRVRGRRVGGRLDPSGRFALLASSELLSQTPVLSSGAFFPRSFKKRAN